VEIRGVRMLSYAERAADAAAAYDAGERCYHRLGGCYSLEGCSGLRRLSLCRVRGDLTPRYSYLPALPLGLQELTLDSRPPEPPLDGDDRPENLDLRHLTALTKLTLFRMTTALLKQELLSGSEGELEPARFPPRLRVLSLCEPACSDAGASLAYLSVMLRMIVRMPGPAHLPVLHVRADKVKCWLGELWPSLSGTGPPEHVRIQTRCLSMIWCRAPHHVGNIVCSDSRGGLAPDETLSVQPAEALCQLLRSMPLCVTELSLGCVDRRPLCLRLEVYTRTASQGDAQSDIHEASYATAADLADSLQQLAGEQGCSVRLRVEDQDTCVVVSRLIHGEP